MMKGVLQCEGPAPFPADPGAVGGMMQRVDWCAEPLGRSFRFQAGKQDHVLYDNEVGGMRQRRIKGLDEKLDVYSGRSYVNPRAMKGRWQAVFEKEQPIHVELGCGKGRFVRTLAAANPDRNFLAVEGNGSVLLRALQRTARERIGIDIDQDDRNVLLKHPSDAPAIEKMVPEGMFAADREKIGLRGDERFDSPWRSAGGDRLFTAGPNLVYAYTYIRSVPEIFDEGELAGIYLNFSDPWTKDRQASRRLTHRRYLEGYRSALRPGGFLEFKTDNEELFRFSVEEFKDCGLEMLEYTEDLHGEGRAYDAASFMTEYEQKFSGMGHPIYYCKVRF